MANLRLWWQIQTDRMGLTDLEKPAPAMNQRVAAGLMTLFGFLGTTQLVILVLELASGRYWVLRVALSVVCLLVAVGYFLEWRRAKRLAGDS